MSFVSPAFLVFFPAVLLLSRLVPERRRWLVLLPASWLFYAWHNVWLLGLLLLTTLVSYGCALRMDRCPDRKGRKRWAALCASVCLGVLFLFKYLDLALSGAFALAFLFGAEISFAGAHLLLPMGISFYVFQTMSYTFDVYRGTVRPERHFGWYALFVSFFPQLVAGPIERPGDLLPQLKAPLAPDWDGLSEGALLLVRGYAKKVLIADYLALFIDAAYADPAASGGAALIAATALFAVQIYCDFSGYSDIALGCARLLGVRLTQNFDRPYAAVTVRDFWRRWHISLTRWFTDYLYIPLGGSRRGTARQCVNILLVFLASGLWHGAELSFVVWGALHGVYLAAELLLFRDREPSSAPGRLARRGATLLAVDFAWVFFRADSLDHAGAVLSAVFTDLRPGALLSGLGMDLPALLTAAALLCLLPLLERLPPLSHRGEKRYAAALSYSLLLAAVCLCRCLALTGGGDTAFLYFQF